MKKILLGILLLALSYGSTYLFDYEGRTNEGRALFLVFLGIILFIGGLLLIASYFISEKD